ncbi:MAG TPA: FAD:protein FMN transferase, partial [Beijerinckiaceae bacterium]|nr:FAD:protein FMN transferase [Beijerinckiaceae bacterium]
GAVSRRRFIGITAAAAGLSLLPATGTVRADAHVVTWRGTAMGAVATLRIHHHDRAAAERLVARALAEVRRLEQVFSLYRDDSAIVVLNRHGVLAAPPAELVQLLAECRRYWELTDGLFDPTVQALWTLYRDHFSKPAANAAGPPRETLEAALDKVGFPYLAADANRIVLRRRGMGLTLNGIAQGYVTDRVVDMLRAENIDHSLVDMGESRALGARPDLHPWTVAVADPDGAGDAAETLQIVDQAVATSAPSGFRFDPAGRCNHLFDPRSGLSASLYRSVTVVAPTATAADALSTACSLMPVDRIESVMRAGGGGRVLLIGADGTRLVRV